MVCLTIDQQDKVKAIPFRFESKWLLELGLKEMIQDWWEPSSWPQRLYPPTETQNNKGQPVTVVGYETSEKTQKKKAFEEQLDEIRLKTETETYTDTANKYS